MLISAVRPVGRLIKWHVSWSRIVIWRVESSLFGVLTLSGGALFVVNNFRPVACRISDRNHWINTTVYVSFCWASCGYFGASISIPWCITGSVAYQSLLLFRLISVVLSWQRCRSIWTGFDNNCLLSGSFNLPWSLNLLWSFWALHTRTLPGAIGKLRRHCSRRSFLGNWKCQLIESQISDCDKRQYSQFTVIRFTHVELKQSLGRLQMPQSPRRASAVRRVSHQQTIAIQLLQLLTSMFLFSVADEWKFVTISFRERSFSFFCSRRSRRDKVVLSRCWRLLS